MKSTLDFIVEGKGEGEVLVSKNPISFFGDIDPETGVVRDQSSNLKGLSIAGKILITPGTRGSTVGSYVIFSLMHHNVAPKLIIVKSAEPILITGCVISDVPLARYLLDTLFDVKLNGKKAKFDSKTKTLEFVK